MIPNQIAKLRLHSRKNRLAHVYENPLSSEGHLLLCGHMSSGSLIDFVHELYDISHGKQPLPLCVLTPKKLSKKLKNLLHSRKLGGQGKEDVVLLLLLLLLLNGFCFNFCFLFSVSLKNDLFFLVVGALYQSKNI